MRHRSLRAAVAFALSSVLVGCGGSGGHDRPQVIAVFPTDGQVLPGWLGCIRITYDEPIEILSERAVRVAADDVEDGGVPARLIPDPDDPASVLVVPDFGGHFFPNERHHVVVHQGAVVNGNDHYALDEFDSFFTVGPAPNLFLATTTGNVYEVDPATGAQVSVTVPPAGFQARDPVGSDGRVWVWLDAVAGPTGDELGSFVPGDAAVTPVPISGIATGRSGSRLVLDASGRTLYATAVDTVSNRLFVHRIDVPTLTETGSIALTTPLSGAEPAFQPAIDLERDRLYVPLADGAAGFLAVVDLGAFVELDVGPGPGIDALPLPDGAGDAAYELARDVVYVLLEDETAPGFVLIGPRDFAQFPAREPTIPGVPEAIFPTPDGFFVLQGLSGYPAVTMEGLVRTDADEIGEGFPVVVSDDTGIGPEGSTRVGVLLRDPRETRFFAFADDGFDTVLALFDFEDRDVVQVDLDPGTPGIQSLDLSLSAPGVVTGATTLFGACGLTPPVGP